ncbi:MAG: UDP-N-acetylmuramoyl-tripeptide--D-alanyl-D-alanine ligase [Acidobacteriales bacterium]|nr:UDP-N-acetylmuramoyl-tripeptide--D-alanyl-D-alanine ligase [Terriglobales bacterium]
MKLDLRRIAEFISADFAATGAEAELTPTAYSIDSRTIQPGELFFAVKGERLDGHEYVDAALQRGAIAAVVSKDFAAHTTTPRSRLLAVDDTLVALQTLAAAVRRLWGKPLIAVTGSAGKTTTKEIIAHLLATQFHVMKSLGNLNNHFGLPLQLLKLEAGHDIAVIELGMSHAGEIAALAKIAKPETGVVTCVAPVHLESFNSVADIARAKYELIASLPPGGTAILNADDPYVSQFGRDFKGRVITFGVDHPPDVRAENIQPRGEEGSTFTLVIDSIREEVSFPLLGKHNILNALAAAATALENGIKPSAIAKALADLKPSDKRGETIHLAGAVIINDCYNSNPTALKAMMDVLSQMPAKRRIVVAGEMLELGNTGAELHRETGIYAKGKADILIGVRGLAKEIVQGASEQGINARFVETPAEAGELLANELHPGDVVLMKASRGVKLETALQVLRQKLGAA